MPSINLTFTQAGPLVLAHVGVSSPHREALLAASKPVPQLVTGTFLLDTGASGTCIDPSLVAPLNLTPTGAVMMQTPSTAGTPVRCYQYDISLIIPGSKPSDAPLIIGAVPVIVTPFRSQGIDGLIGRDVLNDCLFIYNGPIGVMTLSY